MFGLFNVFGKPFSIQFSKVEEVANGAEYEPGKEFSIFVGTGGDIRLDGASGGTATFKNVPDGTTIPGVFTKIYDLADGTTAEDIVALPNA